MTLRKLPAPPRIKLPKPARPKPVFTRPVLTRPVLTKPAPPPFSRYAPPKPKPPPKPGVKPVSLPLSGPVTKPANRGLQTTFDVTAFARDALDFGVSVAPRTANQTRGVELLARAGELRTVAPNFPRTAAALQARGNSLLAANSGAARFTEALRQPGAQRTLTGLRLAAAGVNGYLDSTATTRAGRASNGVANAGADALVGRFAGRAGLVDAGINLAADGARLVGAPRAVTNTLESARALTPSRNASGAVNNLTTLGDAVFTRNTSGLGAANRRNLSGQNGFFPLIGAVYGNTFTGNTAALRGNVLYGSVANNRTFARAADGVFGSYDATVDFVSRGLSSVFGP